LATKLACYWSKFLRDFSLEKAKQTNKQKHELLQEYLVDCQFIKNLESIQD
jgi:hypothetical protein